MKNISLWYYFRFNTTDKNNSDHNSHKKYFFFIMYSIKLISAQKIHFLINFSLSNLCCDKRSHIICVGVHTKAGIIA